MKRKWMLFLLAGVLCVAALSGCWQETAAELEVAVAREAETPAAMESPAEEDTGSAGDDQQEENRKQSEQSAQETVEQAETENRTGKEQGKSRNAAENNLAGNEDGLPLEESMDFIFASGAGAWGTLLTLHTDGTFTGNFGDTDMSEDGDGYKAIHYFCNFSGKFGNIRKLNEYSYSMTLEELQPEEAEEHIEDEILYEPSDPYGLTGGKSFVLYTPDVPVSELDEEFKSWCYIEKGQKKLSHYGIWNQETADGFFTYE